MIETSLAPLLGYEVYHVGKNYCSNGIKICSWVVIDGKARPRQRRVEL